MIQDAMKLASDDVIALEPELTRWDTVSCVKSDRLGTASDHHRSWETEIAARHAQAARNQSSKLSKAVSDQMGTSSISSVSSLRSSMVRHHLHLLSRFSLMPPQRHVAGRSEPSSRSS